MRRPPRAPLFPYTTLVRSRWEQRAEFSSRHPVPEPRTSAGSFLKDRPATQPAPELAIGRGNHFKIRPPDKDDGVPHGVSRGMWGAAPTVAVYRVQRAMRFA